jgi:hypothetical protein
MRSQTVTMALVAMSVLSLSGCVTDKAVLTNAQGQTLTCETKGRIGIVSGVRLHLKQQRCIKKAEGEGYRLTPATPSEGH